MQPKPLLEPAFCAKIIDVTVTQCGGISPVRQHLRRISDKIISAPAFWATPGVTVTSTLALGMREFCFMGMFDNDLECANCGTVFPPEAIDRQTGLCKSCLRGNKKPQTTKPKQGFIYFIQGKKTKLIKIGFTINVLDRFAAIQATSPDELILLAVMEGSQADELALHGRFSEYRNHHEWFDPSKEVFRYIAEHANKCHIEKRLHDYGYTYRLVTEKRLL